MHILFVCSGNICRSPTAEAVARAHLAAAGLAAAVTVDSCGMHGFHTGEGPDPRALAAARARGYELGGLVARRLEPADFARADLLMGMDDGHLAALKRAAPPAARARIQPFLSYAPGLDAREVPDPYYGGGRDFETVLDLIEAGAQGLVCHLTRAHP